ncbi:hypothetical protein ACOME3_006776 [Neoechinorhynchus agilis]
MLLLLVKQSGQMQVFMDLYVAFTRAIADKCSENGAIESHPIEYLSMVKEMLMVENELVTKYFDESYRVRLLNTIETSMICNRAQQLGKAVKVLLANQNKEGLSVLYTHMKACEEGQIMFRNHYRKCLAKMAIQLIQKIQRPSDYFELICDLLSLEFEHRAYVDVLFDSDTDMHHCVNDAFTEAVCTSGVKIAPALVHYTDGLLEKMENRPTEPSEEFIAALQNIILFLRHVHERDIFEVKRRKSLLERVISGQCSIDYEHVMAQNEPGCASCGPHGPGKLWAEQRVLFSAHNAELDPHQWTTRRSLMESALIADLKLLCKQEHLANRWVNHLSNCKIDPSNAAAVMAAAVANVATATNSALVDDMSSGDECDDEDDEGTTDNSTYNVSDGGKYSRFFDDKLGTHTAVNTDPRKVIEMVREVAKRYHLQ